MQDTVPAPTDTSTYEGRHRSREPGWIGAGSVLYEPRHAPQPAHKAGCWCRLCTVRPGSEAVLTRHTKANGGAR